MTYPFRDGTMRATDFEVLRHRALEIVVEQDTRTSVPGPEGGDVTAQEGTSDSRNAGSFNTTFTSATGIGDECSCASAPTFLSPPVTALVVLRDKAVKPLLAAAQELR